MDRTVAIHQPNFFPWLGYFDKIRRAQVFVVLDHVQYAKTGGTWSNRVRMRIGDEARWVTAPISRAYHGLVPINAVTWDSSKDWRSRIFKSIVSSYGKARFFRETITLLEPLLFNPEANLAAYNLKALKEIAAHISLGIEHWVMSSELDVAGHRNDLLVDIVRSVGGNRYLCGGGSSEYQNDDAFSAAGIDVVYQQFVHPIYPQGSANFIAGLSIVDALMHVGASGTRALVLAN